MSDWLKLIHHLWLSSLWVPTFSPSLIIIVATSKCSATLENPWGLPDSHPAEETKLVTPTWIIIGSVDPQHLKEVSQLRTWVHLFPPSDCLMFRVPPLSPWNHFLRFKSLRLVLHCTLPFLRPRRYTWSRCRWCRHSSRRSCPGLSPADQTPSAKGYRIKIWGGIQEGRLEMQVAVSCCVNFDFEELL